MTRFPGCSDDSAAAGEQLAGSAPQSAAWLALEQPGPWGPKAFTDSHLDPELGRTIETQAAAHDVRPALIRSPGRHADEHRAHGPRTVLAAHTRPGRTWLLHGSVEEPEQLRDLDWSALGRGDLEGVRRSLPVLHPTDRPHLLLCTNGTRDVCCATKGRPVVLGLAGSHPGEVWEVTHTSGHRFAPTGVLLPAGTLHGRLALDTAAFVLDEAAAGRTVLAGHRGRCTWPAPAQVAELEVRGRLGELGLDALDVLDHEETAEHAWVTRVGHADGRSWRVEVRSVATDEERRDSCAKGAKPLRRWETSVSPAET
ncbi:MAG TPA: sucrase ferredoxin [Nocardioidaceae bacterium]|nr:sucrase ferredoxin [Nocardioidaceae bacterium]